MFDHIVRLLSIQINDFKNVGKGVIDFQNPKKSYQASILGLYGQNGSGKTALIDAIRLLKYALTGEELPTEFLELISDNAIFSSFDFVFSVTNLKSGGIYRVQYEFKLGRMRQVKRGNDADSSRAYAYLYDEVFSYSYSDSNKKQKFGVAIDTRTDEGEVFIPATKYRLLVGGNENTKTDLMVEKRLSIITHRSFIFGEKFLDIISQNCKVEWHQWLFEAMSLYGTYELFVIQTSHTGLISMNIQPFVFMYHNDKAGAVGEIAIVLDKPNRIPSTAVDTVHRIINSMNDVLSQIVPGLTIGIRDFGDEVGNDGTTAKRIQLVSQKNGREIPFRCESDGIKKIVSVLQLLIVVYNNPSITVAIDELDSGIFEYLLGELLRIISENGKGQLIFTSHNLRPLETIDKGFIAFTTSNPDHRYIRMLNVKTNHNLRDFYYRDIILGEQNESLYDPTNNYEIALAFREAGDPSGT